MARRILYGAIVLLLVAIASVGALAGALWLTRAAPSRLVALAGPSALSLLDRQQARTLASDVSVDTYGFPAPSPDGARLAFVSHRGDATAISVLDIASGQRRELAAVGSEPLALAWSPDGRYLVYLLGGGRTTHIVAADGSQPAKLIASGGPSYYVWSPDGSTLLLHLGGHSTDGGTVAIYRPGDEQARPLLADPGLFQAPAWSRDGTAFYYVSQPPLAGAPSAESIKSRIMRARPQGGDPVQLIDEGFSDVRLVRSPKTDQIAYLLTTIETTGTLKLIDGAGGAARPISRPDETVTSFFWSPDGTQIAYLTSVGSYAPDGRRRWHIATVASGHIEDMAEFTPSTSFAQFQAFFDAYTFSFSPWSPDSAALAYGTSEGVYTLDVASGRYSRRSDGTMAVWVR